MPSLYGSLNELPGIKNYVLIMAQFLDFSIYPQHTLELSVLKNEKHIELKKSEKSKGWRSSFPANHPEVPATVACIKSKRPAPGGASCPACKGEAADHSQQPNLG
jgi:hypothetical protein